MAEVVSFLECVKLYLKTCEYNYENDIEVWKCFLAMN